MLTTSGNQMQRPVSDKAINPGIALLVIIVLARAAYSLAIFCQNIMRLRNTTYETDQVTYKVLAKANRTTNQSIHNQTIACSEASTTSKNNLIENSSSLSSCDPPIHLHQLQTVSYAMAPHHGSFSASSSMETYSTIWSLTSQTTFFSSASCTSNQTDLHLSQSRQTSESPVPNEPFDTSLEQLCNQLADFDISN